MKNKNKTKNKTDIVKKIVSAAQQYKSNMVGYTFLYAFEGKYIEVVYRVKDFMHLTGVDSELSAGAFFKDAIRNKLRIGQISFTKRHPYDLAKRKCSQLNNLQQITNSPVFILEDLLSKNFRFMFGITDLNFTICLSHDIDPLTQSKKSELYIPRSLRVEDSFHRISDAYEVQFIFKKPNNSSLYEEITYQDNRSSYRDLPQEVLSKINVQKLFEININVT